jgi:large subunit ribosomal protein L4
MKLDVYNIDGNKTERQIDLNEDIFNIEPNDHAIYLDVKRIMNARRQGTHSTKERSFITGSTKKLRKQKGLGAARTGNIKSPIFRGGGTAFGPRPKVYSIKINKKVRTLARKSALSYKLRNEKIMILEDFSFEEPKTKKFQTILKKLEIEGKKIILVLKENDPNILLSARNIQNSLICTPDGLNTYQILKNDTLVLTESVVDILNKTLN